MHFQRFIASTAVVAVMSCAPVLAATAEIHTIVPAYPDKFTLQMTSQQDDTKEKFGTVERSRFSIAVTAQMTRTGDGFQGVYSVDRVDMQDVGPDGKVIASPLVSALLSDAVKSAGVARVTLNAALEPVTVDNIEQIKTSLKSYLVTKGENGDKSEIIYNAIFANLTPEGAAQWAKAANRSSVFYNIPLTLGQPVETVGAPAALMGTQMRNRTVITLQSWEEGKTARLHSISQPLDEDLDNLAVNLLQTMAAQMPEPKTDEERAARARMSEAMSFRVKETCDTDVDLTNTGSYRSVCDSVTTITINLAKMAGPEDPLPEGVPESIDIVERSRKVSESKVIP